MNYKIGLIGVVFVVALLAGCTGTAAKDCGEDIQCFAQEAETCSPAIVRIGDTTSGIFSIEIKGGTPQACTVYYSIQGGPLSGKSMTCTVGEQMGFETMVDSDWMCDVCTGSLLEGLC